MKFFAFCCLFFLIKESSSLHEAALAVEDKKSGVPRCTQQPSWHTKLHSEKKGKKKISQAHRTGKRRKKAKKSRRCASLNLLSTHCPQMILQLIKGNNLIKGVVLPALQEFSWHMKLHNIQILKKEVLFSPIKVSLARCRFHKSFLGTM